MNRFAITAAVLVVGAAGCTTSSGAPEHRNAVASTPTRQSAVEPTMSVCPLQTEGTVIELITTPHGIALEFTTSADNVEAVRRHIFRVCEIHNAFHALPMSRADTMELGEGAAEGGLGYCRTMACIPSRAELLSIDGGARLTIEPKLVEDVDDLRQALHRWAELTRQRLIGCSALPLS